LPARELRCRWSRAFSVTALVACEVSCFERTRWIRQRGRARTTWVGAGTRSGPDPGGAATVGVDQVGVDQADRLHERVHGGWADERETLLAQGPGQGH